MDVREKLVELIRKGARGHTLMPTESIANCLVEHGVTVQELDGCEYCDEDNDGYRTMFGAFSLDNPRHGNVWTINTGHCKPRQIYFCPMCGRRLPQPPKGE